MGPKSKANRSTVKVTNNTDIQMYHLNGHSYTIRQLQSALIESANGAAMLWVKPLRLTKSLLIKCVRKLKSGALKMQKSTPLVVYLMVI